MSRHKSGSSTWPWKTCDRLGNAFRKAGAANANHKINQFWQQDNHPIELSTNKMMDERLNYIHNNPVEAGFTEKPEEYLYSSTRDYMGIKGLVPITIIQ